LTGQSNLHTTGATGALTLVTTFGQEPVKNSADVPIAVMISATIVVDATPAVIQTGMWLQLKLRK